MITPRSSSADFTDAIEKIILGAERQVVMTDADRERTAYHESGHALVGMLTPGADPVRKVSIIPRGQALGVTLATPESDRYSYRRDELLAKIKVALGGRAAEKVVFGDLTTGAESDIQNLTQIARSMVGRWGMSDAIGAIAVTDGRDDGLLLPGASPASGPTQQLVDEEVRRIVDGAEHEVTELLGASAGGSRRWLAHCSSARPSTNPRPMSVRGSSRPISMLSRPTPTPDPQPRWTGTPSPRQERRQGQVGHDIEQTADSHGRGNDAEATSPASGRP